MGEWAWEAGVSGSSPAPVSLTRRPMPERLRYLAAKLREGGPGYYREGAALALEVMAQELAAAAGEHCTELADRIRSLLTSGPIGRESCERYIRADFIREVLDEHDAQHLPWTGQQEIPGQEQAATGERP